MELRICGLATVFLRNIVGSAASTSALLCLNLNRNSRVISQDLHHRADRRPVPAARPFSDY